MKWRKVDLSGLLAWAKSRDVAADAPNDLDYACGPHGLAGRSVAFTDGTVVAVTSELEWFSGLDGAAEASADTPGCYIGEPDDRP